ncbi:MAG: type I DNA topoisomerase [Candidatus Actinomarina sp.]|tara:strand:- start:1064 stop:3754 length:2691 start_codon:yes stop_codon:yes gene_type:complete
MSKPLVIVESPTKVKTISKILGSEYIVKSSVGHIRDLPRNSKSIPSQFDSKKILWGAVKPTGFENIYVIPDDRKKIVSELKEIADKAPEVYLATDDDREGEAIAYHLKEALELQGNPKRIKFNEITEAAVTNAINNPGKLDIGKFKSYEARRTLDRMIGYEISPKVRDLGGAFISTGRVQGPAIRLIVEREEERVKFIKSKYFEIRARCASNNAEFDASLKKVQNLRIATSSDFDDRGNKTSEEKRYLEELEVNEIVNILSNSAAKISKIKESSRSGKPPKPFKTTSLQTSAKSNLGFQPRKTMGIAQRLYQEGLITYMRTDSIRLSDVAVKAARSYISENFSESHLPNKANLYGDSKNAQAAHEAIRPSGDKFIKPEELLSRHKEESDEYKLYKLIFNTTVASQMTAAKGITKTIEIEVVDTSFSPLKFSISGTTWTFGGYRDLIKDATEKSQELPDLNENDEIKIINASSEEKYTNPPNRYSSTSLINKLEELGIGRPSTYVSIIESITSVFINSDSSLKPRILAIALINNFMKPYFNNYIDYEFSKSMEDELDKILESENPDKSKVDFLEHSHNTIKNHISDYGIQDPLALTTINLPFESRYVIKTGRIQGKVPYPYLLRDDDFKVGLPPEITLEEIKNDYIKELEINQEESLKKERTVSNCGDCSSSIYIKLGPNGSFYIQHGIKQKGVRQEKCEYKNLIGPIFEDENPDELSPEECKNRFSLSAKNPRKVTENGEWTYLSAVGPYGGYAMKQRGRTVFNIDELTDITKEDIRELIENEKYKKISNYLGGEILKIPKSVTKQKMIELILDHYKLDEKYIKKLSKDHLVGLAKSLEIVFYRGRFRMKPEDATKDNLINKILIEKKNKPLESPRDALSIESTEIMSLFGDAIPS